MIEVSVLLVGLVNYAYYIIFGLIIVWVLIGWFPTYPSPSNRVLRVLYDLVGNIATPIMRPIRRVIPPLRLGGLALDLAPAVALFALSLGRSFLLVIIASLVTPVVG
jgi:YggT family protein